jgi:hypothetical protein
MPQAPESQNANAAGRILAIGDLHGNHAGLRRILLDTGLIDAKDRWTARDTHLVLMGDVLGRGGEPGKIFDLVRRLEAEALACGSRVHLLLGNHEALALLGILRYNTLEEFHDVAAAGWDLEGGAAESFGPASGGPELDAKLGKRLDMLGAREFRLAFSPRGGMGAWLLSHASAVALNGHLFVHGGLNRAHGLLPLEELNALVRSGIAAAAERYPEGSAPLRGDGPQWNRDYILHPGPEREAELQEVLDYHACRRMVVGHTPTSYIAPRHTGRILPIYRDRMYCIDTGIGRTFGGHLSALSLEDDGKPEALYFD